MDRALSAKSLEFQIMGQYHRTWYVLALLYASCAVHNYTICMGIRMLYSNITAPVSSHYKSGSTKKNNLLAPGVSPDKKFNLNLPM